jgi:actin-related protein 9
VTSAPAPATTPQYKLPQPPPATLASASTPPTASRRDSQSSTPTSRRRRSARKPRTKVSRKPTNSDTAPDYSRSQLERFYPPIRYPPQSLRTARSEHSKGAATAAEQRHPRPVAQPRQNEDSPSRRYNGNMASGGGKWREEQILIVCPGSRTTMAQLGCSELTPPAHRIPTRMFRDGNEWRPYHTYKRTKIVGGEEQEEWVEDVDEDKGAVYPIEGMDHRLGMSQLATGRLTIWCFLQVVASSTWMPSLRSLITFTDF